MEIKDMEVYLILHPNDLMKKLSINEWNDIITSYENDKLALISPYDEEYDGWCFITTTLKNVMENHSLFDLRFLSCFRTEFHLSFNDKN